MTAVEGAVTTTYTYDRADQLIEQTIAGVDTAFAYNAWGDMTTAADSDGSQTTHAYDAGGRMISLTPSGSSAASFTYDALGRVATRTVGGTSLTYRYVGVGHTTYGTVPGAGSATYALVDAASSRLAVDTGGTTAWSVFDLHGNFAGATAEASTTIVNAVRYDAWGSTLDDYAAGSGSTATPWRYQGRLDVSPDADEPLYDYGARMYRPSGGTFTQLDTYAGTAQNPLSMNRFLYAHANPTTLIDPTGHCVTCPPAIDGYVPMPKQGKNASVTATAAQQQAKTATSIAEANPADVADELIAAANRVRMRIDQAHELERFRHYTIRVTRDPASATNDVAHTFLDGCGLLSGLGTFCDIGNAALFLLEGDLANAGLSVAGVIPGVSEAVGGARLALRYGDDVLSAGTRSARGTPSVVPPAPATRGGPDFIAGPNGGIAAVPHSAVGPSPTRSGGGIQFTGGSGGHGLNERVTGIRIMPPSPPDAVYPYPNGYVVYMNASGQTVNPYNGRTVEPTDFWAHVGWQ